MAAWAICLAAVWKLDGKGRVADGNAVMAHIVTGLTSPQWGRSIRDDVHCVADGEHPGCEA